MHTLIDLERDGWQALSQAGDAGRRFYEAVLRDDAVMLFPGGLVLEGKRAILDSLGTQPWTSFEIRSPRLLTLSEQAAVVIYQVTARREGQDAYAALISSTYTLDASGWKLVLHQQTPV